MDSSSSLGIQLLWVLILILINAFFAMSEIAFVSLNQNKVRAMAEEGDKRAQRVMKLLKKSGKFLATIQVVITFAGFLNSASAATSFAKIIEDLFPSVPGIQGISILVVTIILSFITLVFGELFPKQIALQMPEEVALFTSRIIGWSQVFFSPFVALLTAVTNFLQKVTPIEFSEGAEKFTRDEMRVIIDQSREEGSIDLEEFSMLEGVLSLDNKMAREIMVPRTDTEMIDIEDDYNEILETVLNSPFSRIPLYEDDKDNVIGVIHMKNLLKAAEEVGFDAIDFRKLASEPMVVPSTIYIDDLLVDFRREQNHMAILKDEYGGMEGIVTMEDVLEEIVGEIEDETDVVSTRDIRKIDNANYYVKGGVSVEKFANFFDITLEADEVDTIAGLIIYYIGYVPEDNEKINVRAGDYILTTSIVENGRIRSIHVFRDPDHKIETKYDFAKDPSEYDLTKLDSREEYRAYSNEEEIEESTDKE